MGRLAGYKYQDVAAKLRRAGFVFDRAAKGSHEIWLHPGTGRRTMIPNHPGDVPEGTLRAILKQAGLTPDEFFSL